MKYNILYLHETSILGGAENSLLNLVSKLDKNKLQPFFICPKEGPFIDELKKLNIKVDLVKFSRLKSLNLFRIYNTIRKIKQIIGKREIDLVHSSGVGTNLFAAVSAKLSHVPIVWHARNLLEEGMWDIDRFFSFLPDKIICNSEAIRKRFYKKRGKIQDKIITIINGVDIDKVNPKISGKEVQKEFNIEWGEVVIGIASRLDPSKGHGYFLHAAVEVAKSYPRVRFLIVGDAFSPEHSLYRENLRNLVQKLDLENKVIFVGFRKDMPQVLAGMDIFVLASDAEPCGRVLFEAIAMGKPIVATNTGGTPEIVIDKETGLLVPARNSKALAKALITLLNNRELAKEMGQKGRKRVEKHFTIEEHVRKTETVYNEFLLKEEFYFDYERHIWGKPGSVMSLKDRRNSALGLRRFLEVIDNVGGRILEVGCGAGMFIRGVKYYRPDLETYGCDISRIAILTAKKAEEYDIHYEVAEASSLPYKDRSFDVLVMTDVLEHLEDIKGALREARRVLKEGGILHILVPCEANKFTLHWLVWKLKIGHNLKREYAGHIQRLTTRDVHRFIEEQCFVIVKESFSFHSIGQIYDIFFDYLPRTFQRKRIIDYKRKKISSVRDKISRSLKERGIILTLWAILGRLIEIVAFYESEIFKNFPLAIGVHLTCQKEN